MEYSLGLECIARKISGAAMPQPLWLIWPLWPLFNIHQIQQHKVDAFSAFSFVNHTDTILLW